jgi:hypothetical protein
MLDAGYVPEDIANEAYPRFSSWWGEESAMWSKRAEQFDRLLSHEDKRIQKIGELAKARVEASRESALNREQQEAIHGLGSW